MGLKNKPLADIYDKIALHDIYDYLRTYSRHLKKLQKQVPTYIPRQTYEQMKVKTKEIRLSRAIKRKREQLLLPFFSPKKRSRDVRYSSTHYVLFH